MWSKSNESSLFSNTGMTCNYLLFILFYQTSLNRLLGTDLIEADLLKNAEEQDCQTLLDIGSICFKRGSYQKAMLFYSKAAGLSDLEGMRRLGCLYFLGRGVEKDYESSVKWLLRAANNGYAPAQYNIGFLYECGRGVPCDIQTAQFWYKCSASQGCSNAFRAIERLATANNSLESFEQGNKMNTPKKETSTPSIKHIYINK
jgi:tetratricopeptide (TPR) repeat protein